MKNLKILNINKEQKDSIEPLGTKEKFWFFHKSINTLFKVGRENTGEDWVEVVVSEICSLLDIPHAQYSFATYEKSNGTVTPSFVPDGGRLIHGNELLVRAYKAIEVEYNQDTFYKLREYNLKVIHAILKNEKISPVFDVLEYDEFETAFDMFIGYLVLDCLISNQDRHHENWGLIVYDKIVFLAPTYDHASGLGSKEHDIKKEKRLTGDDPRVTVKKFVERAKTPFYDKNKLLSTYESVELCAKLDKNMTLYWLSKIENLNLDTVIDIFAKIPTNLISDTSSKFAIEMVKENKNRLLEIKRKLENE